MLYRQMEERILEDTARLISSLTQTELARCVAGNDTMHNFTV